ncbi:universal stress protein [Arthrobacter sp. zg-ZUI100]|uniref:Universal stress protein n=1 Tax=Arthrobacter jiangjiafuii TaxID=2817475 RepID=A0A975M377_9MICC|nr:universal stress protein [Arthrobacter jiangjiafuii]MBP3036339.1 universal stress protein [Arthrobacter jiangjiafuii]MBP3043155.1 universal stress protein [Arthrobacter jiangjiafuii]QWC08709.1 universal stress protein [Arthrobacter jiangjiafuii]
MSIVVGFLPTPEGTAALDAARREALLRSVPLVIVNVAFPRHGLHHQEQEDANNAALEKLEAELTAAGTEYRLVHPVGDYDPAEEILNVASGAEVELVVLGLRRRTPVGKMLLGSTAQRVLLQADCPVLAVKATS